MIVKQSKSNNFTLVATVCTSLLFASCSNDSITNSANNTTLLAITSANALYCPGGSENKQLDFTNVKVTREQNIPLMYQGYNNIEGPVWHDGALYYSNMGSHQPDAKGFELSNQTTIWFWVPGNKPQVWMKDTIAGTNGLALNSKGNLVEGRQLDGSPSTIDWQTKHVCKHLSKLTL
jgi:gluconolactonase